MRTTINATLAPGLLVALIGALLLVAGPVAAEAKSERQGTWAQAGLIARGAGYSEPQGSARVRALQRRLLRAGESPGPVDGRFGPLTEAAVRRFQSLQGLAVDGLVGPLTAAALRRAAALIAAGEGYGEPRGSARVRALQRRLLRAGESPGPVDGRFGPLTEAAVRRFQSRQGLAVDGLVGQATGGALARRFAALAPQRPRALAPRPEGATAKHEPGANAKPRPSNEPEPVRVGKAKPTANPGASGPELPGLGAMLAVVAALALLLAGALVLALGRPARRRHAGTDVGYALLTARLRPEPATSGAVVSGLPRPSAPQAGRPNRGRAAERPSDAPGGSKGTCVLGYASVSGGQCNVNSGELREQAEVVAGECERRGLELLELVRDREPHNGKGLARPGLRYALRRISAGDAQGLVVSELSRLTRSAAELGTILEWFTRSEAQLVAVAEGLDTDEPDGRLTARTLIGVSGWERERLRERTYKGLQAARLKGRPRGRPAVADNPELRKRIIQMRAEGLTLQAIADRLNEDGVATVRGGVKWRPSSVQAAVGYKRRWRPRIGPLPGRQGESPGEEL